MMMAGAVAACCLLLHPLLHHLRLDYTRMSARETMHML
jgi:hypothetical protein